MMGAIERAQGGKLMISDRIDSTSEAQNAEIEALRRRARELEEALDWTERSLQAIIDHIPGHVYVRDLNFRFQIVNNISASYVGGRDNIIGKPDADIFSPDIVAGWRSNDLKIINEGATIEAEEAAPYDDGVHTHRSIKFPIRDRSGAVLAVGGVSLDVTAQKRAEEELLASAAKAQAELEEKRLKEQIIKAQQAAIEKLGTPLIPLTDDAVVIPLVGSMDEARARLFLETLLHGMAGRRARVVIIDVTGVSAIDAHVAEALAQAARAVKLLGAQVIMTGINPTMARTLIELGIDFQEIVIRGSLQAGIAYVLKTNAR
jgi:rsbT co-antagonist protein RsbR